DRLLVGVELVKIPGVVVGLAGAQPTAGIASLRVLDLDDLGAEPRERFGARRPSLELRKVDNANAFETIQLYANSIHFSSLLPKNQAVHYRVRGRLGETGVGADRATAAQLWSYAIPSKRHAVPVNPPAAANGL